MNFEEYVAIGVGSILLLMICLLLLKKAPRRLKNDYFVNKWKALQQKCADKTLWPEAISDADDLLNEALKRKRFKGKSMGERLVSAQKIFTNNDAVWYGHKLRMKLDTTPDLSLTQDDVQRALVGLRQGLKDIGALK